MILEMLMLACLERPRYSLSVGLFADRLIIQFGNSRADFPEIPKSKLFNNVTGQNRLPPMNRLLGEIRSEGNDTTSYVETSPPNILRQKTGQGGHEEIADFILKEYGNDKDEVIYTLDKISESCRLGNITIVEKARLKKLLLSSKEVSACSNITYEHVY